jgi:hypothetical protein
MEGSTLTEGRKPALNRLMPDQRVLSDNDTDSDGSDGYYGKRINKDPKYRETGEKIKRG